MPFAYIMGISWDDSFEVAELLGVKTFLNEFIAYQRLAKLIQNRVDQNSEAQISVSTLLLINANFSYNLEPTGYVLCNNSQNSFLLLYLKQG